jgi:hypothetical protein
VQPGSAHATLSAMGLLSFVGMPIFSIMPERSEVLFVLLVALYLAAEFVAPIAVRIVCAALSSVRLGIAIAISSSAPDSDDDAPRAFPFLTTLASRAPPVS